jgi:MFS family permease
MPPAPLSPNAGNTALSWLNFLVALMQTGFGAFLAVYLTNHGWSATSIGFVLSVGTVAALVSQVPAGFVVDWAHSKRGVAAVGIGAVTGAALLIAAAPLPVPVYAAQILQGMGASVIGPAIAAITLALSRQDALGERLGRNVRFAAIGSSVAAAIMGAVGLWLSERGIFLVAAACAPAALLAIYAIQPAVLEAAPVRTSHHGAVSRRAHKRPPSSLRVIACDRRLLIFAACCALFTLGNASLLPLVAGVVTKGPEMDPHLALSIAGAPWSPVVLTASFAALVVPASIIIPQLLAAAISPQLGQIAHTWARRPVLLLGCLALPIRATLFAIDSSPGMMVCYQALDGVSAAVFGVMVPLVIADITHEHGRFNLAMGVVGLAMSIGATISTAVGGALADSFGAQAAFLCLAAAGAASCFVAGFVMPETHLEPHARWLLRSASGALPAPPAAVD